MSIKLGEVRTGAELIALIAPKLDEIAADPNIQGTVQLRIDPLLASLPKGAALTAKGVESLKLDGHELAYLQFRTWKSIHSGEINQGIKHHESFAEILQAALDITNRDGEFVPFWLRGQREFVHSTAAFGDYLSSSFVGEDGPVRLGDVLKMSRPKFTDIRNTIIQLSAQAEFAGQPESNQRIDLTFMLSGDQWNVSLQRGVAPLKELPTHVLEVFKDLLAGYLDSTSSAFLKQLRREVLREDDGAKALGTISVFIDTIITERYKPIVAAAEKTIAAFKKGELDSAVGAVPKRALNRAARA
jgi:hypothetical protein